MLWILMTLMAAVCQTARTALQKQLKTELSDTASASTRFLFACPFAIIYLVVLLVVKDSTPFEFTTRFWIFTGITAISQIIATWALIAALSHAQFAVAVTYSKLEPVVIAVLGASFFAQPLNFLDWTSIVICIIGLLFLAQTPKVIGQLANLRHRGALLGVLSAISFGISSLAVRESSHALQLADPLLPAAISLVCVLFIQLILTLGYLLIREPQQLKALQKNWKKATFVGLSGGIGSIGWFTAFSLQTVALVKVVGQVELIFAILLTHFLFKEKIRPREYMGMLCIVASVVIILVTI
ncbi:MAG: DMT family transporter [Pseudomonadota bacterium]